MTRYTLTAVLLLSLTSCGSPTDPNADDSLCGHTSPYASYGCTRIVVLPGPLPPDAPSPYWWKISVRSVEFDALGTFRAERSSLPEEIRLQLNLWSPLLLDIDTATVTVVARVRDRSGPIDVDVPLPLIAIDSASHLARFAPVGERAPVDTVRLDLGSADER